MNTDDLNFAYKVRHALNDRLEALPPATTDRLAAARQLALSRKKAHVPVIVAQSAPAGLAARLFGGMFEQSARLSRLALVVPLLVLGIGMVNIYQDEQDRRTAELAELDAAVLSDELPLSAYLDHGFNAYLTTREQ